ncbi:MAG: hypothetical protein ACW98F_04810 [Candidatus Hodarchaeales archaeon]
MSKLAKKAFLCLILFLISSYSITLVGGAFPYALTTEDLPEGFELVSTTTNTDLLIVQTWKTPSDTIGMTTLTAEDSGTKSNASTVIDSLSILGATSVSVSGSDEAKKIDLMMMVTIYARIDKYIIFSAAVVSTEADVITLIEAQITKIPGDGGGAPGFILLYSITAISSTAIILRKKKE